MSVRFDKLEINTLFVLECGCILDGCHDSHPGQVWRKGDAGKLYCFTHKRWELLKDVVTTHG